MTEFVLNGAEITERKQIHEKLALGLSFPDWYGGNLDALYDCLTGITADTRVVLRDFDVLEERLGKYATSVKKVMKKAAEDNPKLSFVTE
ncbi:MAG: barstar family protein [Oscillospiraceae bacterium]|nr:barstar family protein [Oscillospiraceae bacterium]